MSRRLSVLMLVLLAGAGIAVSYFAQQAASPRIAAEQRASQARELLDLLPVGSYDNQPLDQPLPLQHLVLSNSTLLGGYRASRAGQPSAVLLRSQVTGYAGPIELLIAIDAKKVSGPGETPRWEIFTHGGRKPTGLDAVNGR